MGFFFLKPFFMTGDDPLMTLMAQGGGKDLVQPSEFLMFFNVILGLFLKKLYTFFPGFHWYGAFQMAVFSLSIFSFVFLFLSGSAGWKKLILWGAIFPFEFFHYFIHFQYTLTAFWAFQAGLFLLLDSLRKGRNRGYCFFSVLLLILSCWIRPQAGFLALSVASPFVLFELFQFNPAQRRRLLSFALLALAVILPSGFLSQIDYQRSPGWPQAQAYLDAYVHLVEYRDPESNPQLPQILKASGWSGLDFILYKNWFWQGSQFTVQKVKDITSALGPPFSLKASGWQWIFRTNFLLWRLLLLVAFGFFTSRKKYFLELANFLVVFLIFLLFFYVKKTVSWVVWPLFSYPAFLCLYYAGPDESVWEAPSEKASRIFQIGGWALLALWVGVSVPVLGSEWRENQSQVEAEKKIETDIQALAPQKDRLYVIWATLGGFPLDQLSVFGNYDQFKGFPIYSLTWEQPTPRAQALLERFQIRDLPRDMVGRKDVFLIARKDFLNLYGQYLRENYHIEPAFNWVFHGSTFDAYQVVDSRSTGDRRAGASRK